MLEPMEEATFGELVAAHSIEPIDVDAESPEPYATKPNGRRREGVGGGAEVDQVDAWAARVSSATSLGTVLSQALRTNDGPLLESCLHSSDITAIRSTIQRLESPLATSLLSKLAERMHRRPGRAGSLLVWIQWTLVAHGGYLAGQPEIIRQLAGLHQVLADRARALQPLLALKGKLDMLDAQMQLRRAIQPSTDGPADEEAAEDERIIYVEGQAESDSDDERPLEIVDGGSMEHAIEILEEEEDDDEGDEDVEPKVNGEKRAPTTNGIIADSDDMVETSEEEDEEMAANLIDDEAEETDSDSETDLTEADDDADWADDDLLPAKMIAARKAMEKSMNEGRPAKRLARASMGSGPASKRRR
ncbi:MAG: Small subunit (SSU) processome component [Phylliscum demangeonii]|nr:MAG: Small subunit (SSU) processome component [Phylliscum demangeonii]